MLKIARICLAVFFVFIAFGLAAPIDELELFDPPIIRVVHSIFMLGVFISTYLFRWVRANIQFITNILFYTMSIHSFILLYWNGLYIGYLIGMVLVITCIGVSFVQKRWLVFYLFFVIVSSILVGLYTEDPQVNLSLYFPTIITPALVSYLTLNIRLSAVQKLRDSEVQLKNFYSRMSEELEIAQETQKSLVALSFPKGLGYRLSSYYRSFEKVGGDVLSVETRADGRLNILFADVSGHGIASAMVSAMTILAFKIVSRSLMKPAEALLIMHELLKPLVINHHISATFAVFDPRSKILEYSYAGHHPILLLRSGSIRELSGRGSLILSLMIPQLQDFSIQLQPGDRLIFYSDGLVELFNEKQELYGDESFYESILRNQAKSGKAFLEALVGDSVIFAEGKISDDMTLMSLDIVEE
jgi:serine phosphatase RsbU (regulator of sigma subunit)